MIIDREIKDYIIFYEDSLSNALSKISENKRGIIFAITEHGTLEGAMTDGDFRRWLVEQDNVDLNQSVSVALNREFTARNYSEDAENIESDLSDEIKVIPLVDEYKRLVAIAWRDRQILRFGDFELHRESPTFIIAEIGLNHNGSLQLAKDLVKKAAEAGADCAKFQMRSMANLYYNKGDSDDMREDVGSQYVLDLLARFQLKTNEMYEVFDYCKEMNLVPLCTPWDLQSLEDLEKYGMTGYKIASADLTNHELLNGIVKTRKPVIVSTGMSVESEILESVKILKKGGLSYALLHCNSTYPAPFKDINLNYLSRLKEVGDCLVGYSGHERGYHTAVVAVALGAKIVEKHFTLDKTMEGNDHKVSLLPEEFSLMTKQIREIELAMGDGSARKITQGELMNRSTLAKSIVINKKIKKGELITEEMLSIKSPGKGLQPNRRKDLIGLRAKRDMDEGEFFYETDLLKEIVKARDYSFNRPWGIPVRYHDYTNMISDTTPDFIEFHLSYKDMELKPDQFFKEKLDMDLVVHSPDLFKGDYLLNLCSPDIADRKRSVVELQKVIDLTNYLKKFFTKAVTPKIVVSVGGFTKDAPVSESVRDQWYEIIADSLSQLNKDGVEILPQTLPPYPWYFGGQLYLNLFVTPEDTANFCKKYGYRICYDVSHSKLACNKFNIPFSKFTELVAPYSAHLHIVDARGVDGEGIQIDEGEVDFKHLIDQFTRLTPKASFIPEIWQGHHNSGEGFWVALERLEKYGL